MAGEGTLRMTSMNRFEYAGPCQPCGRAAV